MGHQPSAVTQLPGSSVAGRRDDAAFERSATPASERAPAEGDSLHRRIAALQRTAGNRAVASLIQARRAPGDATTTGGALPDDLAQQMGQALGADFSAVRVHVDASPGHLGALAYTRGDDLHFAPGRYDPGGRAGRELLGHELTHVVQQRAGRVPAREGGARSTDDLRLEAEASRAGKRAADRSASPAVDSPERVTTRGATSRAPSAAAPVQCYRVATGDEKKLMPAPNAFVPKDLGLPTRESKQDLAARMKPEMDTLRKTMEDKEKDPAKMAPGDLGDLPPAFLDKRRTEREAELKALREGTTDGGRQVEGDKDDVANKTVTATDLKQSGPSVTSGAAKGAAIPFRGGTKILAGGGDAKLRPLTGGTAGALEHKLNNPAPGRGRLGIAARQQNVMAVANKADPFMRALEQSGDLSKTHRLAGDVKTNSGNLKAAYQPTAAGDKVEDKATHEVIHAYGMNEYGNRPQHQPKNHPTPADYPERLLPELTDTPAAGDAGAGETSRVGRWSEADVDPLGRDTTTGKVTGRNADRLLHTAAASKAKTADGAGGATSQALDHRFYVTGDHYESAVPVTPVETGYKATKAAQAGHYERKYADPTGQVSSLAHQDKLEQERLAAEKAAQEKAEQERLAAEKVAQEKAAQEKAAQERLAAEKAAPQQAAASPPPLTNKQRKRRRKKDAAKAATAGPTSTPAPEPEPAQDPQHTTPAKQGWGEWAWSMLGWS